MSKRYTYEEVKKIFKNVDYTLLSDTYINNMQKLEFRCDKGHVTYIKLSKLLLGQRCNICDKELKSKSRIVYTQEDVVNYLNTKKYKLLTNYTRVHDKIKVECDNGHIYDTTFSNVRIYGCRKCFFDKLAKTRKKDIELIRNTFMNNKYTLQTNEYENEYTRLTYICNNNHTNETNWKKFQTGCRCPDCNGSYSKAEKEVLECIKSSYNGEVLENNRTILNGLELDIYIPEYKMAIEYCGLYWHTDDRIDKAQHRKKLDLCKSKGIRLITIFEDEWLNKKDIVKSKIMNALNKSNNTIYARKCILKAISSKESNEFYSENHLQEKTRGKVHIGLFYEDELVMAATLGSLSRNHVASNSLELKRLATKNEYNIVGGASKLFKYLRNWAKDNNYNYIRSYCDLRWGTGGVYDKLGFQYIGESKYTPHYILNRVRYRNQSLRKTLEEKLTNKTEIELRTEQGYKRIWDCGHQTWDYNLQIV